MAETIKLCDMHPIISVQVFQMLNPTSIRISAPFEMSMNPEYLDNYYTSHHAITIITDVEPKELVYPEGWYYAKGKFRNKGMSTTGACYEIWMVNSDGKLWGDIAHYCSLYV